MFSSLILAAALFGTPPEADFRVAFLHSCDVVIPLLDDTSRKVSYYQDSYAVRALAVAYDLTQKKAYLDACRRWCTRMCDHQDRMIPHGAYYMNYGRKPGESKGDWYVGDDSSIALALLATSIRTTDGREMIRFFNSVTTYAKLVIDTCAMPCGGITDGMWDRFDGEWWCSTGIFGSLCFVLYDQTGDPAYLKIAMKAVDWLNRQRFENAQHIDFKEAAPSVLMYVFEAYSAGMPHLQRDPLRWEASQVELRRALAWMDANQPSRNPKSTWKFDHQWGSKLGGLPFHAGVWSRFLTGGPAILAAVDKDLVQLAQALQADPSKLYQLRAFALMSFAERLMPGAMYRVDPPKVAAKPPAAPPTWKAGVASAKITPQKPMWMSGYAARKKPSEGIAQDLFAKALVLQDAAGQRVVFITMDIVGIQTTLRDVMERRLAEKFKLPAHALVMSASHTHCGPSYHDPATKEDDGGRYHRFLEETLIRIVGDAIQSLAPAQLSYGHARAGFAMNRRANHLLPKTDVNYGKAPNPNGPVDHDVPVLRVADAQGHDRAILFGYACHNTTLGFYEFCGDYAGFAQQYLQEDQPGVTALFIAGCGADQNPYPRSTLERAREHGRSLATAVEAALFAYPRPLYGSLHTALEKVRLQKTSGRPDLEYPVQVISLGPDVTLIVLASEITVDYSLRLKHQLAKPPAMIWVAGYCNAYFGYIPSDRVLAEGGYEADGWKTPIEERIIAKALELVRSTPAPATVKAGK